MSLSFSDDTTDSLRQPVQGHFRVSRNLWTSHDNIKLRKFRLYRRKNPAQVPQIILINVQAKNVTGMFIQNPAKPFYHVVVCGQTVDPDMISGISGMLGEIVKPRLHLSAKVPPGGA
jgi:hypothetical protein